jgi:hypothetical protein
MPDMFLLRGRREEREQERKRERGIHGAIVRLVPSGASSPPDL